jgi:hypothetical protein
LFSIIYVKGRLSFRFRNIKESQQGKGLWNMLKKRNV